MIARPDCVKLVQSAEAVSEGVLWQLKGSSRRHSMQRVVKLTGRSLYSRGIEQGHTAAPIEQKATQVLMPVWTFWGKREISNLYLESNHGLSNPPSELYTAVCCVDERYLPSPVVTSYTASSNIQSAFKYCASISGQVTIIPWNSSNCPTQMGCVCCAVETAYLNVIQVNVRLQRINYFRRIAWRCGTVCDVVGGELGWCEWVRVSCCEQGNELEASGSYGRGWTLLWACVASVCLGSERQITVDLL